MSQFEVRSSHFPAHALRRLVNPSSQNRDLGHRFMVSQQPKASAIRLRQ
jgi:hypothetical protein